MNFKQALIAHLQGERVQKRVEWMLEWLPFTEGAESVTLAQVLDPIFASNCEFRLAPRTIRVNGVEVPSPERGAPQLDTEYFVPSTTKENWYAQEKWSGHYIDKVWFERGLVYLNKEDAIARAKAMLLTQE